MGEWRYSSAHS